MKTTTEIENMTEQEAIEFVKAEILSTPTGYPREDSLGIDTPASIEGALNSKIGLPSGALLYGDVASLDEWLAYTAYRR